MAEVTDPFRLIAAGLTGQMDVAGLPLSGQDASRKKGSVGPHQQPTTADPGPHSP